MSPTAADITPADGEAELREALAAVGRACPALPGRWSWPSSCPRRAGLTRPTCCCADIITGPAEMFPKPRALRCGPAVQIRKPA